MRRRDFLKTASAVALSPLIGVPAARFIGVDFGGESQTVIWLTYEGVYQLCADPDDVIRRLNTAPNWTLDAHRQAFKFVGESGIFSPFNA